MERKKEKKIFKGGGSMLIIGNGKVITRDTGLPFIENGAVAIEGTRIVKVGTDRSEERRVGKEC